MSFRPSHRGAPALGPCIRPAGCADALCRGLGRGILADGFRVPVSVPMPGDGYDVVVIGAGLVGGAIAYGLARAGQRVAVLDEEDAAYRASRGDFGLVWVQGKGVGRPEYALWSRVSSERWFEFAEALAEDCGLAPCYERPGGVIAALSEEEVSELDSMLAGIGGTPDRRGLGAARRIAGGARLRHLGARPHEPRARAGRRRTSRTARCVSSRVSRRSAWCAPGARSG